MGRGRGEAAGGAIRRPARGITPDPRRARNSCLHYYAEKVSTLKNKKEKTKTKKEREGQTQQLGRRTLQPLLRLVFFLVTT